MLTAIPLTIIPLIIFNIVAFAFRGDHLDGRDFRPDHGLGRALGGHPRRPDDHPRHRHAVPRDHELGATGTATITNHILSTIMLIVYMIEFILIDRRQVLFFILTMIALFDMVAGFTISIRTASRDIAYPPGSSPHTRTDRLALARNRPSSATVTAGPRPPAAAVHPHCGRRGRLRVVDPGRCDRLGKERHRRARRRSLDQIATGEASAKFSIRSTPRAATTPSSRPTTENKRRRFRSSSRSTPPAADRRRLWIEDLGRWYAGPDGRPLRAHGVIRVINERHEREQRLAFLSRYDELTGYFNRAHLVATLGAALNRASEVPSASLS